VAESADRLIAFGQPPPNSADFVLYRLLTQNQAGRFY